MTEIIRYKQRIEQRLSDTVRDYDRDDHFIDQIEMENLREMTRYRQRLWQ